MNPLKIWLEDARRAPDTRHVDACDGLRALAILIIGWFHIWQQSWLFPDFTLMGRRYSLDPLVRSGYIWVDAMILISGFCLYLPWARLRIDGGVKPDTLDFYARRLARIHPSYLLCVLVMLAVALVRGTYYSAAHLRLDVAAHLTYTHTFFYQAYYATNLGGSLWTLVIEMQFYLLFPLLARAFMRLPATTLAVMVGISLAFRGLVAANVADVSMLFNQLPAYLDVYACGMAAALIHVRLSRCRHNALTRLACTALSVAIVALLWQVCRAQAGCSGTAAIQLGQMARRPAMGLLCGLLVVTSANSGLVLRRLIANPLTRFISSISLQFYIWHQTLAVWFVQLRIIPREFENPNYAGDHPWQIAFTALCFLGAIALSALLTFGFERPAARALLRRWTAWRKNHASKQA